MSSFDRRAVDLQHLAEPAADRAGRHWRLQRAPGGLELQGVHKVIIEVQQRSSGRSLGGRHRLLA
jgi:hypothetical protein